MSEIRKYCCNCKYGDCSPLEEPCKACLVKGFTTDSGAHTMWEPKAPVYPDTVFKTENDLKIDHINERVDDIQANVLEYCNNIVSKLIKLDDKLAYLSQKYYDINNKFKNIDSRIAGLESTFEDIQKTLETIEEGVSNTEENVLMLYLIRKELEEGYERVKKMTKDEHITLTSKKDPLVMTSKSSNKPKPIFQVGNTVKYKTGSVSYFVINVTELNTGYCYDLERRFVNDKRHYKITGVLESRLEEVK